MCYYLTIRKWIKESRMYAPVISQFDDSDFCKIAAKIEEYNAMYDDLWIEVHKIGDK